jgi:hypothetical protein
VFFKSAASTIDNATAEEVVVEELTEEQLTRDLASFKIILLNLKITRDVQLKSVSSCSKQLIKKFY